ncbi:MAG: TetR/AcrR family transcriptional regulator [Firmicutes bacterium]|nr:TetR/AcrR family transcriptional regulator [Bacillota bacterium]
MEEKKSELERRDVLRMSNDASNKISRECICIALLYLLKTKDLSRITITELVTRAGVSRATFYRNYDSKEDVLREIEDDTILKIKAVMGDFLKPTPYEYFLSVFMKFKDNAGTLKLLMSTCFNYFAAEYFRVPEYFEAFTNSRDGYKKAAVIGTVFAVAVRWIAGDMKETPEELAAMCAEYFHD